MKKFGLRAKIFLTLGLSFLTTAIVLGLGINGMSSIKKDVDITSNQVVPRMINALKTQSNFRRLAIAQYRLVAASDKAEKEKIAQDFSQFKVELEQDLAKGIKETAEARLPVWREVEENYKTWLEKSEQIQKFAIEEKDQEANEVAKLQRPFRMKADEKLGELVAKNLEVIDEAKINSAEDYKTTLRNLILFSIVGMLVSSVIAWISLNVVIAALNKTAGVIHTSTEHVASASNQIASASHELSQASTEQASSLAETAAALEEISSMIGKASDNSEVAAKSSQTSNQKAQEGQNAVEQMIMSMDEISESNDAVLNQINESNRQMVEIVQVIQEIGNKTKVINEIVFQTKLLSFNASVEAARAGEHGKGFAVVAEEVGSLAQMSGNAAKDITDMLGASISKVEGIVKETQAKVEVLIESGKAKVDSGVKMARNCSEVLNEIVQNISQVADLSQDISQASREQAKGVEEINKAMSQLDSVTQQNASASEQASGAAESLSAQSESLKQSVNELMQVINGQRRAVQLNNIVAFSPKSKVSSVA